jgi:acyl carrier protein
MSALASMERELIDYIAEVWLGGDAEGLDAEAPILELNIIDSAAIFDLVHHLQDRFRVSVPLQEISPENFRSVAAIAALVDRLRKEDPR